jgi:hypothetical protein
MCAIATDEEVVPTRTPECENHVKGDKRNRVRAQGEPEGDGGHFLAMIARTVGTHSEPRRQTVWIIQQRCFGKAKEKRKRAARISAMMKFYRWHLKLP